LATVTPVVAHRGARSPRPACCRQAYSDWRAAHPEGIDPDVLKDKAGAFSVSDAALQLPEVLARVKDDSEAATKKVADLLKDNRVGV
jgi:hypothetical protein